MTKGKTFLASLTLFAILIGWQGAFAHGGVGMEDDMCVIKIGFLQAHFTGYQPLTNATEEFCEDIPEVGSSVFVIDYLHDFLKEMQVDFRIVRDVNEIGVFANWDDIRNITDIDSATVYYSPLQKRPRGTLTAKYEFKEGGGYIGVVTAVHPEKEKTYRSVFYFQVGGSGFGYIPLFVALVILVQAVYFFNNKLANKRAKAS
jgi:hypothetical protein